MTLGEFDQHNAGAAELYNLISNSFISVGIPIENGIAFVSDGCSTMMGQYNSLATRLRRNNPGITIVSCPSHKIHLCAEAATKMLLEDVIQFCYNCSAFLVDPLNGSTR